MNPLLTKIEDIKAQVEAAPEVPPTKEEIDKLPLYLVFAFDRLDNPNGGGFDDLVKDTNQYSIAVLTAHRYFARPYITGVQIVNRFSGKLMFDKRKESRFNQRD